MRSVKESGEPQAPVSGLSEALGASPVSGEASADREKFAAQVQSSFAELTGRGYTTEDAAAMAFRHAAGVAPLPVTADDLVACVARFRATGDRAPLLAAIEGTFGNPDVLSTSFYPTRPPTPPPELKEDAYPPSSSVSASAPSFADAAAAAAAATSAPGALIAAGAGAAAAAGAEAGLLQVDFEGVRRVYQEVRSLADPDVSSALQSASARLVGTLERLHRESPAAGPSILRQALLLLESPYLEEDTEPGTVLHRLCALVASASAALRAALVRCFQSFPRERFVRLLEVTQQLVSVHLLETGKVDDVVEAGTAVLACLHAANEALKRPLVPYAAFYLEAANEESFDLREDYRRWKQSGGGHFSFCTHAFVYDPAAKSRLLQLETSSKMMREFETAVMRSIFDQSCPYCVIRVRRSRLISDTLREVARQHGDLRKPLKVQFVGEDGVDEGGVAKEFFQLVVRSIFNPEYGMFTYDDRERFFWFASHGLELVGPEEYELVGTILGLALYNGHILDLRFPLFVYSKLTGNQPKFSDLAGVNADLHRGLQQLLDFAPASDVEAAFCLSFQVSRETFGCVSSEPLCEGGAERAVTGENRREYVELYTQWYLHGSIERQFAAFEKGFRRLCKGPSLALFRAEELESLLCGNPDLDFQALERGATYDDGYTAASDTVRWFWSVAHSLTEEQKKRLLFFATGSDRVPIKGLHTLPFVLSRNGTGDDRLPSAHTCFNHLLVPEYSSEGVLREKLLMAIANAEGFGLM